MSDEFYVGYLPAGPAQRRFLIWLVPLLGVVTVVLATALALQQGDAGDGQWNLRETITLEGRITADPYATLTVPSRGASPDRKYLLVTMGKIGGDALVQPVDGQWMRVTGYPIERDGRTLLTLEHTPINRVEPDELSRVDASPVISLGRHALNGEIVDPKCYFGAMRPGEGRVHKACATLCIRGGIPPMFVTHSETGQRNHYLLTNSSGGALRGDALEALLPYVADPVAIEGEIQSWGDLLVFRINPDDIVRQ